MRSNWLAAVVVVALTGLMAQAASEKLPANARLERIEVHPARIVLNHVFDYSQLVLTGVLADGERLDVTRMVDITVPPLVRISPTGQVRPLADGTGVMRFTLAGKTAEVPLTVSGQKTKFEPSFVRDVMPILSRLGCNQGTCHGAEAGKGGFKLSLRGYDPLFDYRALTDDLAGRRINRAAPDASLMLMKPSGAVPHVGGVLFQPGEPYYEVVKTWIADGLKLDLASPRVRSLEVVPGNAVIGLPGQKQQLAVLATYTDGKVRDVSAEAFLESSNTEVATVDRQATVTGVRRGEATILARYEGAYAASTLIVMGDRSGFAWKPVEEYNWIDTLVYEKLRQVKVLPSEVCTDSEFIRRVHIDLTGVPPEPAVVRAFLADTTPSRAKREQLVDRLIGSPDFIEHWTNKWADLLQVNRKYLGNLGAEKFRAFIRQAIADNMPYDRFVYQILTASGSNIDNPAASYYKTLRTADAVMENTTQLFLAVRFNCNKCHDHPFERWTQDQYYHLAAYFAQVGRSPDPRYANQRIGGTDVEGAKPLVEIIADVGGGEITHARTNKVSPPAFPYLHKDLAPATAPRRVQLAKWLTSPQNQYFARSYVNRLWAYLLGVGLIEPIDDIRAGNPPTNPKLLDRLTEEFIKSGFDVRHMMRLIVKSRTYQHSVSANAWNVDDQINYSRAIARRLPAEVLYDAIHRATGSVSRLPGLPAGARAAQLLDSAQDVPGGFLDLFGKPPRESSCECERVTGVQLGPVLNLVNGPVVAEAIKDPNNRLAQLLRTEKDDRRVIEEVYLAFLCRLPTAKEMEAGLKALKDGEEDYNELLARANQRKEALAAYEKTIPARLTAWEAGLSRRPEWKPVEIVSAKAKAATLKLMPDGSILATDKNEAQDSYTVQFKTPLTGITALRLEVLPDDSLPAKGPGRAPNGNFVLNELKLTVVDLEKKAKEAPVALFGAQATFEQGGFPVGNAIDNNPATGWAIASQFGKPSEAMFQFRTPINFPKGALFTVQLIQRFGTQHTIGKFRLSVTTTKQPLTLQGPPTHLASILDTPPDKRTPQQLATLTAAYRAQDAELNRLIAEVNQNPPPVDRRHPGLQDLAWALINSKAFQFNH
jgi:hypothetical protein